MSDLADTRLDPIRTGYHPSVADQNEAENERDDAVDNLDLLGAQKVDTADVGEYNVESESEKGQQSGPEKPQHVGFWAHELNNVRLHVIKLWCRTGGSTVHDCVYPRH